MFKKHEKDFFGGVTTTFILSDGTTTDLAGWVGHEIGNLYGEIRTLDKKIIDRATATLATLEVVNLVIDKMVLLTARVDKLEKGSKKKVEKKGGGFSVPAGYYPSDIPIKTGKK